MGVRITQLTELTTPADNDVLAVVDINDTTQSPDGTTKKITIEKLLEDVNLDDYYTKTEIDNMIGDIGEALDSINGEVI